MMTAYAREALASAHRAQLLRRAGEQRTARLARKARAERVAAGRLVWSWARAARTGRAPRPSGDGGTPGTPRSGASQPATQRGAHAAPVAWGTPLAPA